MRHRISVFLPVLCLVALAACGDDEPFPLAPCETDATCGGYRCQLSAGSATGACSSSCAGGCASGFECGEDTLQFACVPVGSDTPPVVGDECNSDAMCGGYACLIAAGATTGACSSSCADGCAPGFECGEDTLEFACVPVGSDPPPVVGDECNSDAMCGGYACLIAAGATTGVCSTSCEEGCAVGFFCGGLGNLECWLPGEGPTG